MHGSQRSALKTRQELERRILIHLAASRRVTQRSLASDLGIALGLTNLLMRRLVRKGWVRIKRASPRWGYVITPAGILGKARLTRQYFLSSVNFYRECRAHVRDRLLVLSSELQAANGDPHAAGGVVFYGAGEVAEVAYVCLQETALELLGVVDDNGSDRFLRYAVQRPSELAGGTLGGRQFSKLVVMPCDDDSCVRRSLALRGVPPDLVFWL